MILNYQYHLPEQNNKKVTLVFIHGLFGSLSNLGMLVRAFEQEYPILQVDLRNHGESGHSLIMNYEVMAQDVLETINQLKIQNFIVIGHSMGGKVAMQLAQYAAERLKKLIILDIAPVAYQQRHHDEIFEALITVENAEIQSRKEATEIMQNYIKEIGVVQFLLKSFAQGQWKFNVKALIENYQNIIDWNEQNVWAGETLFIRGGRSDYLAKSEYVEKINKAFPHAIIDTVENAGHWLHAEKTAEVTDLILNFINKGN